MKHGSFLRRLSDFEDVNDCGKVQQRFSNSISAYNIVISYVSNNPVHQKQVNFYDVSSNNS